MNKITMDLEELDEFSNKVDTSPNKMMRGENAPQATSSSLAFSNRLKTGRLISYDNDNDEGENLTSTCWNTNGRDVYWGAGIVSPKLSSGLYSLELSEQYGPVFKFMNLVSDELLILPDSSHNYVIEEIQNFWTLKDEFQSRGFLHKRGILLWGDPGSGKTCTIRLIIKDIIERGGIAAYATQPVVANKCLGLLRQIESVRPIVVILEDFETLCERSNDENGWLSLLDGESQIDNVVFVATTNYPEKLDKRFVDRPSRFDTIKKIPMPSDEARRFYLKYKEKNLSDSELDEWVNKTKGFSIAHLKELIIGVKCLKRDVDSVIKQLKVMQNRKFSSNNARDDSGVGFLR